ncbi:hypothetical protein Zmor_018581 [Zophobas morio]|uniref:HTH psq-type domain-containing protein n=1 Tax=Zophobas morio TaxID=2755281 RepID=A0AA38I7L2_9CUCU|nr:hypothetical protein Zmor_018581 [Zophobas morio]
MPRKYQRKQNVTPRVSWTEENLHLAIDKVKSKQLGVNEASREYSLPSRTLRRRIQANNSSKLVLGKPPALGKNNEDRLVIHIQKLQTMGFAPSEKTGRTIAYNFAKKLNLEHKFCVQGNSTNMAGTHWFYSFMDRNRELSLRKSEGLSLARAKGMNRQEVEEFYDLLKNTLEKYNLFNKPGSIFNMDESGIQINNKPDRVVAKKGSKCVHVITSKEKVESISVIACANAEGTFLPPVLILKGVRKNSAILEGMPPSSDLYRVSQK